MFALTFRFYPDETPEGTRWCVHETTHSTLDQACYDTWESMWGRGKSLADELAEILKEAR